MNFVSYPALPVALESRRFLREHGSKCGAINVSLGQEKLNRRHGCNRRAFLAAALEAVAGVAMASGTNALGTAARAAQAAGSDGYIVIDAHIHFYDPSRPQGVPWPSRDDKVLYRTMLPGDYRAQPVPEPVRGAVVVEASPWLEDNRWVLDLAAHDPMILGFVGNLPAGSKAFAGPLKRFAANKIFRGIRIRDRNLDGLLEDAAFVGDLKLLAEHDLSLDLVGGGEILSFADRLAGKLPQLRIIVDHLAGVGVDGKPPPAAWMEKMKPLIRRSTVYFKLSGLVEGTGRSDGTAPSEVGFYRPVLDAMEDMFGAERLMYASNWPVSGRFAPLLTVQGIIADYFHGSGGQAKEQVFSQTAMAAYHLGQRGEKRSNSSGADP